MATIETALARDYVISWMEHTGNVGLTAAAEADMQAELLDLPDIVAALETSICETATKEDAHDLSLILIGQTCDGDTLRMNVQFDPLIRGVCVQRVRKI
jgi:hypothetical protein